MIRKILVATDGSKAAGKAVTYAIGLAKEVDRDTSITLLGVVDVSSFIVRGMSTTRTPAKIMIETRELIKQMTSDYLDVAAAECRKRSVQARKVIRTGHAAEEIVKEAVKEKADLIVLGSHGRSALRAAVLGSVAYGVIHRNTNIPVLVIRK